MTKEGLKAVREQNSPLADVLERASQRFLTRRRFLISSVGAALALATPITLAGQCGQVVAPSTPAKGPEAYQYPYGGSGVADRAIDGARALRLPEGTKISFLYPSGAVENFAPFIPEWRKTTGIDINLIEVPLTEQAPRLTKAAAARDESYDGVVIFVRNLGNLEGSLRPIDDYIEKYKPLLWDETYGFIQPILRQAAIYRGKTYGFPADNDCFQLLIRKDLLEDPQEQRDFAARYGFDLKWPETWDELQKQGEHFTRPKRNLYGLATSRGSGWGAYWWEMIYASQADPDAYYFDDDMHPLINSPQGISATRIYVAHSRIQHPGAENWDYSQFYTAYTSGNAYASISWPSLGKFANDPASSQTVGKNAYGPVPGTRVGEKLIRRSIYSLGNTLCVWAYGKNLEAAYLWSQWISSPEMSPRMLERLGFLDPYRYSDYGSPLVKKAYGEDFLLAMLRNAELGVPDVVLQSAEEYYDALDQNVRDAYIGTKTPEQAMEETAIAWEQITERIGRESQKEVWQLLKAFYSTK